MPKQYEEYKSFYISNFILIYIIMEPRGVVVIMQGSGPCDPGSNPGGAIFA